MILSFQTLGIALRQHPPSDSCHMAQVTLLGRKRKRANKCKIHSLSMQPSSRAAVCQPGHVRSPSPQTPGAGSASTTCPGPVSMAVTGALRAAVNPNTAPGSQPPSPWHTLAWRQRAMPRASPGRSSSRPPGPLVGPPPAPSCASMTHPSPDLSCHLDTSRPSSPPILCFPTWTACSLPDVSWSLGCTLDKEHVLPSPKPSLASPGAGGTVNECLSLMFHILHI